MDSYKVRIDQQIYDKRKQERKKERKKGAEILMPQFPLQRIRPPTFFFIVPKKSGGLIITSVMVDGM